MLKEAEEIETDLRNMIYSVAKGYTSGTKRNLSNKLTSLIRAVRADEREECAKVAENEQLPMSPDMRAVNAVDIARVNIAASIRGRRK